MLGEEGNSLHQWLEFVVVWLFLLLPITIPAILWGIFVGELAARKHRNGWLWGGLCGVAVPLSLFVIPQIHFQRPGSWGFAVAVLLGATCVGGNLGITLVLALLAHRCPRCKGKLSKQQWKRRVCPACGGFHKEAEVARARSSRRMSWWFFILLGLLFLFLLILPNTGVMDIHQ